MLLSGTCPLTWAVVFAAAVSGSPTTHVDVLVAKPQHDLPFREALELAHRPHLEKRISADFALDHTWKNEVLFHGSWTSRDAIGATDTLAVAVTCVECYTKGTVTARLIEEDIIKPSVRLEFSGVEAYVDMKINMSAGATYALNLFTSQSPVGVGFPGLSVGIVCYIDLVFSLTDQLILEGGFYVKIPDSAFLEASLFDGDITKSSFEGLSSKALPIIVTNGKATFKADLRLRVQCGAEADVLDLGMGAGAELGIYANLIEFVAVLESTETCALQASEWWDLNVGAFARLDIVVDYSSLGVVPTVSTTLLSAPTATQCLMEKPGAGSGSGYASSSFISTTTVTTPGAIPTAVSPAASGAVNLTTPATPTPKPTSLPLTSKAATTSPGTDTLASSLAFSDRVSNSSLPVTTAAPSGPSGGGGGGLVTSTVYTTSVYTITACGADVVNCPASYQSKIVVTKTIDIFTTVCPASASITEPAPSNLPTPASQAFAVVVDLITDIVVLVPCENPIVETFVAHVGRSTAVLPSGGAYVAVKAMASAAPHASSWSYVSGSKKYQNDTVASSSPPSTSRTKTPGSSALQSITPTVAGGAQPTVATAGAAHMASSGALVAVLAWGVSMLV